MNEVFMALLSFGLGVLATLLTQVFARRLKLGDVKRQRQLDDLQRVKSWLESYQILFECKYPEVDLGKFVDDKPPQDKHDSLFAYQALKFFQEASTKCDETARVGQLALKSLKQESWVDPIRLKWGAFWGRVLFRFPFLNWLRVGYILSALRNKPETPYIPYEFRRGIPKVIYPFIKELEEYRDDLFVHYPEQWYRIDWDKLDFIEPNEMYLIIRQSGNWPRRKEFGSNEEYVFMLEQAHRDLRIHPNDLLSIRRAARYTIERALEEIHIYEKKLLVVSS